MSEMTVHVVEYTLEGTAADEVEACEAQIRQAVAKIRARHVGRVAVSESCQDISYEVGHE